MINITINDKKYKIVELDRYDEITINQAIKVNDLEVPVNLLAIYNEAVKPKEDQDFESLEITDKDSLKDFPLYYGKVLELLSNIPVDVIKYIKAEERTVLYKEYLEWFVIRILFNELVDIKDDKESFVFGNETYYYPPNEEVNGTLIPAYHNTAIEFCEASDVLTSMNEIEKGNLNELKTLIAIYCRPKDEKYNELTSIKRAVMFGELPLEVAFRVFFCIIKSTTLYLKTTLTLQVDQELKAHELLNKADLAALNGVAQLIK